MLQPGAPDPSAYEKWLSGEHPDNSLPRNIPQNIGAVPAHTAAQVIVQRRGVCQGDLRRVLSEPLFLWRSPASTDTDHPQVPYRRRYRSALADAFEIYITILRSIEKLVSQELGRDTPDWRVQHACPPCTYEECICA